eukprot:TRINITY_DN713_c0_g1_i2.p1 TRINITY_DN713_c0_g1~~TRINITY_DN713_c0_g1_i2.p1  ORF type:complete len:177 (-),score=26.46 TRINITY_DN713_c0_g1_i2:284-814(-)
MSDAEENIKSDAGSDAGEAAGDAAEGAEGEKKEGEADAAAPAAVGEGEGDKGCDEDPDARKKREAQKDPIKLKKIAAETNEILQRISLKKGVLGIIVANIDGVPIRDTFPQQQRQYVYNLAAYMHQFRHKANVALGILFGEKACSTPRCRVVAWTSVVCVCGYAVWFSTLVVAAAM